MRLASLLALLVLVLLAPACAFARLTDNEPLQAQRFQALHPGSTTAQQAVELLGAPVDVVQLGKRSAYRYEFTSTKNTALILVLLNFYNQDTRADRAWLFFDENQILTHVGVTFTGDQTEYALPWENVHD